MPETDETSSVRFIVRGDRGAVKYAERKNGDLEAKSWLDTQTDTVQASFAHLFRVIAAEGRIRSHEQFRSLEDDIWEFKRSSNRLLTFRVDDTWYLTHQYKKASKKCPKREIERACLIRTEFLAILKMEQDSNGDS